MSIDFKKIELENWQLLKNLEEGSASDMFATCVDEVGYKKYIQESTVLAIMLHDEAIGTISYKNQANETILINGLTVLPAYRGKGVAKQAMEKLLEQLGNKVFILVVHPKNTPALLIYLRLGFTIVSWKDNYFGDGSPRLYLERKAIS